jgi:hypothetical protein
LPSTRLYGLLCASAEDGILAGRSCRAVKRRAQPCAAMRCTAAQRLVRRESRAPAFPCQKGAGRGGRPSPWEQEGLRPIPSATKRRPGERASVEKLSPKAEVGDLTNLLSSARKVCAVMRVHCRAMPWKTGTKRAFFVCAPAPVLNWGIGK